MDEAYADIGRSRQRADKGAARFVEATKTSRAALTRQAIDGADGATEGSPMRRKRSENGEAQVGINIRKRARAGHGASILPYCSATLARNGAGR